MPKKLNLAEKIEELRMFYRRERRMPSYAEMLKLFQYRSKNAAHGLVQRLLENGYVRKGKNGKMAFTSKLTGCIKLLGSVQAGFPSAAEEELVDVMSLDDYLVKRPESTFMLTVNGDSMIEAGIQEGDIILVERGDTPKQDDIVVSQVDEEWTLKYFGRDKHGVYLDPANKKYRRIRPKESLIIGGIVKAVVRKYE